MVETLNKRIIPAIEREQRENARRYWAKKQKEAETLKEAEALKAAGAQTKRLKETP